MHRLVFLRPVSRAVGVQGLAGPSRNFFRAFATSSCRKFRATSAVNKKAKKDMLFVDSELFGGDVEPPTPSPVVHKEPAKPEVVEAKQVTSEPVKAELHEEGIEMKAELDSELPSPQELLFKKTPAATSESQAKAAKGAIPRTKPINAREGERHLESIPNQTLLDLSPTSPPLSQETSNTFNEPKLDVEQYYSSWFTLETREVLNEQGLDRYGFVSAVMQTPPALEILSQLTPEEEDQFDQRWLWFEMEEGTEDKALLPVLEFLLERGLVVKPPTPAAPHPLQCLAPINPEVSKEALKAPLSPRWKRMFDEIVKTTSKPIPYPDLMTPDAMLDPRDVLDLPPTPDAPFHNRVIVRNHRSVFHEYPEGEDDLLSEEVEESVEEEEPETGSMESALPVPIGYYRNLYQSILMRRPVVQQTGKGKIRRVAYMVLVGDGNGLVGYGEGKHSNGMVALNAARIAAVKNMDWVERFEQRTIWTEMSTKLGATELILRPRPVGFGLRCNPFLHQILRAAGLKDISAKVWGSRNKLNVIKAAFRMLHAGHAPTGMGDGVGGKGKKLSKGAGVRGKEELERARGRKLINLRY